MVLANVNNYQQALLLFEDFHIPYQVITRGPNKGALRVKPIRDINRHNGFTAERMLRDAGLESLIDHKNCFRDDKDNSVITFSPYHPYDYTNNVAAHLEWSWLVMSEHSIYGMWTKTFVIILTPEGVPVIRSPLHSVGIDAGSHL